VVGFNLGGGALVSFHFERSEVQVVATPPAGQCCVGVLAGDRLLHEDEAPVDRGALSLVDGGGVAVREVAACGGVEAVAVVGLDLELACRPRPGRPARATGRSGL